MGAVIENVVQAAEAANLSTFAWQYTTSPSGDGLHIRIEFDPQTLLANGLTDHPLFGRHTNRGAYRSQPIGNNVFSAIEPMVEGTARILALTKTPLVKKAAKLIGKASEARFQTREIHEWLGHSLRFTQEDACRGDGLDVATLNLPPGGSLMLRATKDWNTMARLNVIGAYKLFALVEAMAVSKAPALLAIIGPGGQEGCFTAGRLIQRAWIYLNSQGVAVHPYYVLPDQMERLTSGLVPDKLRRSVQELADQAKGMFSLAKDERLHMMLRIGLPRAKAVRSRRLPLTSVCTLQEQ